MAPVLGDRVLRSVTEKPSRYLEDYTMNTTATTRSGQRMDNAATLVPEAIKAILAVSKAAKNGTVPETTVELVHLRASQINGCSVCVDMHSRALKKAGEGDERIFAVSAWRDSPYFNDAERAVLALTESVTRLADRTDPVPDEILGRSRSVLRRHGADLAAHRDRPDKPVEPAERTHATAGRPDLVAGYQPQARNRAWM